MTQPTEPRGTAVWAELRAEKVPGPGYFWHIEGRDNPRSDPTDPENWAWVADVDGTEHVYGHEAGETARLLALRWNAYTPLVDALASFLSLDGHAEQCAEPLGLKWCSPRCARARAALKLAREEAQ